MPRDALPVCRCLEPMHHRRTSARAKKGVKIEAEVQTQGVKKRKADKARNSTPEAKEKKMLYDKERRKAKQISPDESKLNSS
ncbi:TPA: hypothetical protein ACH3X3_008456 [Trebouxia sp. C0006]